MLSDIVKYFLLLDTLMQSRTYSSTYLLQYAHRACVQRWCNEKGDTTCEICHEVG